MQRARFDVGITVIYDQDKVGHVMARIPAVPGVITAGARREEARELVFDALAGLLASDAQPPADDARERVAVELLVGSPRR